MFNALLRSLFGPLIRYRRLVRLQRSVPPWSLQDLDAAHRIIRLQMDALPATSAGWGILMRVQWYLEAEINQSRR